ncbi:hypothetical protein Nepgr_011626 [Nepenthes gracilis]|uniref:Reticulon-like protein n=1 Tax=Nepenthes gracilis TaxID=150966 RepID=A0AAD3SEF3_NEPGR|nr:hypothetical protein Nepgr_011626 [Nepenthes gracilis]
MRPEKVLRKRLHAHNHRLFNRQTTVHQILGGGFVADVVLWRQKNTSLGIVLITASVWLVFNRSGYTLLSLISSVLLLLLTILFLWAKSAALLNRPAPPVPDLNLSKDMVDKVGALIRACINYLLLVSRDIALGKDSRLFFKVAASLLLISVVGDLADLITLGYICLGIILTIPALYESVEECCCCCN